MEAEGGLLPMVGEDGDMDGASVGNVLVMLHEAKKEIIREIQLRSDALHKDLALRLDAMSKNVIHKVISGVSSHSQLGRAGSSRSRSSSEKKRKGPPPPERMQSLNVVLEKDKTPFVLQWSMIAIILSFARSYQSLQSWVPVAAKEHLSSHLGVFDTASGISTLFFSVESDQKWSLYHGPIGQLWSMVLRCSISSSLMNIRRTCFGAVDGDDELMHDYSIPPWLASFGSKQKTTVLVSEIISCLETTEEMARASGNIALLTKRKRMRIEGEKTVDEYESERDHCVSQMRSTILRNWSYGRAEARKICTSELLFLVDKIRSFPSVDEARNQGYEIIFCAPGPGESSVPHVLTGTIWEIPRAVTKNGTEEEHWQKNFEMLLKLSECFPSLTVTLRYRRAIIRIAHAAGGEDVPEFYSTEERVSLHNVALTLLSSSLCAKSNKIVLQTSGLSLRTVHILAIGLRGLLRQSLGHNLTSMEKCALGGLTCDVVDRDDADKVSVISSSKVGNRQGKGSSTVIQQAREEKLTIYLASYREEVARNRAARVSQGGSSMSEAGRAEFGIDEDEDLDESFLEGGN